LRQSYVQHAKIFRSLLLLLFELMTEFYPTGSWVSK
jgi:hypothetical protein